MYKTKSLPVVLFAFVLSSLVAWANEITYHVTVDTGSASGTVGSLDLQFNPGLPPTQSGFADVLNFTSDGSLAGMQQVSGDVVGTLPGAITFDNGMPFNDYFDGFTFGTTLSFDLHLYGPALTSPDGMSASGSTFGFSMFSDAGGTIPILTSDPSGFAFTVDINLDGTTTVNNSSTATSIFPSSSSVPEPSTITLLGLGLVIAATRRASRFMS